MKTPAKTTTRLKAQDWSREIARIADKRRQYGVLRLELYCDNPRCSIREIEVALKDFDHDLLDRLAAGWFQCPLCRVPAKLHWVRTLREQDEEEDHSARCLVNVQRWLRDHPESMGAYPSTALLDDTLPA